MSLVCYPDLLPSPLGKYRGYLKGHKSVRIEEANSGACCLFCCFLSHCKTRWLTPWCVLPPLQGAITVGSILASLPVSQELWQGFTGSVVLCARTHSSLCARNLCVCVRTSFSWHVSACVTQYDLISTSVPAQSAQIIDMRLCSKYGWVDRYFEIGHRQMNLHIVGLLINDSSVYPLVRMHFP